MKETRFKQTDIGLVPEDWDVVRLGDIAKTSSGGTPNRDFPAYYGGKIKWFTTGELQDCLLYDSSEHITEEALQHSSAKVFPKGTLLMAMYGATIGKLGILTADAATNQACCALKSHNDSKYIFYALLHNRSAIIALGSGAGQSNISQSIIKEIRLSLPPLTEQERIAEVLRRVDELLVRLDKLIAKKQAVKQGAMQQLLTGGTRLDGFTEPWKEVRIKDITSDVVTGATPDTSIAEYWGGDIRWMNSGELNLKNVYEVEGRITKLGYQHNSTHLLPINCVLIGLAGQGKTRGTVAINYVPLCTNQSIAAILPSDFFEPYYLYEFLDSKYGELRAISSGEGSRGGLTKQLLLDFSVLLPPLAEQRAIARILSHMDKEIEALQMERRKVEQIKKGMMQQLLTGKIRLSV